MSALMQLPLETKTERMKKRLKNRFLELREEMEELERQAAFAEKKSLALLQLAERTAEYFRALEFGWNPDDVRALKQSLREAGYSIGL